ncbi:MAG: RHS repeat-associated core domain-containing protein, partial [Thaumarchaeota archaeon]|nr:RHS repeat-associated core domain-containing protein [Nitrososphaerota archaeon]
QLSYQAPGQNPVFAEDLTYDARGNIIQRVDDEGTHSYQYDALDQLTRAQYPDSTYEEFAYDKSGNRSSLTTGGGVAAYVVDDADQLVSVSGPGQSEITTFAWTPNGEMASRFASGQSTPTSYTWDSRSMLALVSLSTGQAVTFTYLPEQWLGWRVCFTVPTATTRFVLWDPVSTNALASLDTNHIPTTVFLSGVEMDENLGYFELSSQQEGWTLTDHLGSASHLLPTSSFSTETQRFSAFGVPRTSESSAALAIGYTGREWEEVLGFYNNRARRYDPVLARFVTIEPILRRRYVGASQYGYAAQSPIVAKDPSGNEVFLACDSVKRDVSGAEFKEFSHCGILVDCPGKWTHLLETGQRGGVGSGWSPDGQLYLLPDWKEKGVIPTAQNYYQVTGYNLTALPCTGECDFEKKVLRTYATATSNSAGMYLNGYRLYTQNSNTFAAEVIERSGGRVPSAAYLNPRIVGIEYNWSPAIWPLDSEPDYQRFRSILPEAFYPAEFQHPW